MAWVVELYDDEVTLQARMGGVVETWDSQSALSGALISPSITDLVAKGRGKFTTVRSATITTTRRKLVHKGGKYVLIADIP